MLPEELDRSIRRPVDADLRAAHDAEAILETDLRTAVEAEQVSGEVAEVALSERPREPVRDPEGALVPRHAQRRRQRHECEIRLGQVDVQVRIVRRRLWRSTARQRAPRVARIRTKMATRAS